MRINIYMKEQQQDLGKGPTPPATPAANEKGGGIARALTRHNALGLNLLCEISEKKTVLLNDNESQELAHATGEDLKESIELLQQAGIVNVSESGDKLSLTPEGISLHDLLVSKLK